ncbi:FimV family protein [Massilia sp. MS-15]|uniref:type IV pilus assembly protein FimV n=1 Tax=Massilia sp. MS-15 TaxID=2878200 RepID=UPI001CD5B54C|nr:LPXTG cell wall anchor domain-containing protein [Massilia sp. MS-15]MCA1246972.1 LPXTG cell wall anchor domain-containing protein [Massilia sp. MS-15]
MLSLACALPIAAAHAAELGEPRLASFLGQPLVADIELTLLEDPAMPVQVRLAHPEVYRGAGLGMPPVLSTLRMSVMRRDGRQFLHITSFAPVELERLHLFLELADGAQRTVRLATLSLAPDPHPAPPVQPVRPAAPPVAAQDPVPALAPPMPAPKPAPAVARQRPRPTDLATQPAPSVPPAARRVAPASRPPSDTPLLASERVTAPAPAPAAGACAAQVQQPVDSCVVLGAKNTLLREQLVQLEDKVKLLQVAAGAATSETPRAPRKKRKQPEPPPAETTWLPLAGAGAAVLALLGGLVFIVRRRKAGARAAEPRVGLGARLRARLDRKSAPPAAVEPTLEQGAHESSTQV